MKNNNQAPQLDLFTPIQEVLTDVLIGFGKILKWFIIQGYLKITKAPVPLKKIDRNKLSVKKKTENIEALGIDVENKKEVKLDSINFARHSFIVGSSGFGKTNVITLLQEQSLRKGHSVIFIDPKGDYDAMSTFKGLCDKYQKKCYIFSELLSDAIALNPFLAGSINQVADRILNAYDWDNSYYFNECRTTLLTALINLDLDRRPRTLEEILKQLLKLKNADNSSLYSRLLSMQTSDFAPLLNNPKAQSFNQIRKEGACLYVGVSTQGYGETAMALGKFILGDLLYNSYYTLGAMKATNEKVNPICVYFDEFGSLVNQQFIELQNKCRDAKIELTVAVQTPADIDKFDLSLTKRILENSGNFFIMKQRLQESAELFSQAIGTIISKKQTFRIEGGEELSEGSQREVHELIVHPDIIKNLNVGQCVLLQQGPVKLNLINVRQQKGFKAKLNLKTEPEVKKITSDIL